MQDRSQAEADAAFHLRLDVVRVHRDAAVHGAPDPLDFRQAIAPARDFRDLRDVSLERFMDGDPPRTALPDLGALPAGKLRDRLQYPRRARVTFEQREPAGDGILARRS